MASRVVPAIGETIARELPVSMLSNVDLPTFGWPMIATFVSFFSSSEASGSEASPGDSSSTSPAGTFFAPRRSCDGSSGAITTGTTSIIASINSMVPRPCSAAMGKTSRIPSVLKFCAAASCLAESTLFTARKSGLPRRCSCRANSMSGDASSVRASTTITTASDSSNATLA